MTYSNTYSSPSSPTNFNPFSGMGMRKGGRPSLFPGSGDGSTLSLDFTTGVLDPRLTFSRASTATFVNSSGYVEYAAHNLYYNTNFATITTVGSNPSLTGTGWGYALNSGTSFSATFNTNGSVTMSATAGRIGLFRSAGFAGTGRRLIFSVDITSVGDTGLPPSQLVNEGTKTNDAYYINGTLWTSGNVVGPCTVSFVFTSNPAGNAATYFGIGMSSNSTATNITFAKPRWGFYGGVNQLAYSPNTSATNANYLTAEYHAPRFDYSPTTIGEPRGLLIEGQTANVCPQSQALTTGWQNVAMNTPTVPSSPTITDPFGGTSATWKLVASSSGTSVPHTWRTATLTLTAASYTFSFWAKAAEYDRIMLCDPGTGQGGCLFVLTGNGTATVVANVVTPTNPQITPYPNGWYRCSVTMVTAAANYAFGISGYPSSGATTGAFGPNYISDGISGVYATAMQIELGSGASSYIPTGASQVTRNADLLAVTSTTTMGLNTSEGTFFVEAELPRSGINSPAPFGAPYANGSWLGQLWGAGDATSLYASWWAAQGLALSRSGNPKSLTALSYGLYTGTSIPVSSSLNGAVAAGTFTTSGADNAPNPATWNFITLACNAVNLTGSGRDHLNSCIKKFKYFPTRLSNAQLQTLTTP